MIIVSTHCGRLENKQKENHDSPPNYTQLMLRYVFFVCMCSVLNLKFFQDKQIFKVVSGSKNSENSENRIRSRMKLNECDLFIMEC